MNDLLYSPVLPWPWLALTALALAAALGWSVWRGVHSLPRALWLWSLRAVALAVLVVMLSQPQRRRDEITVLHPQLAVLVDDSESMADPADAAQPRRAERVREFLKSPALAEARKNFDVRLFRFDRALAEVSGDGETIKTAGDSSNLVGALGQLQNLFRGQPLAGVLLLTDGLDTSGAIRPDGPLPALAEKGVPINTFELEKPFRLPPRAKSVKLANLDYPPRVVLGWEAEARVNVTAEGMSGQTVNVELWRDGRKQAEGAAAFNEDSQTRPVAFPLSHERPGSIAYEVRIPDPAADKDARAHPFIIEVLEPGNRVLYLQNALGFDYKFLRKAIVADRNLQLSAFARTADGRLLSMGGSQGAPPAKLDLSPDALSRNSVIILGDLPPDAIPEADENAIVDFVDRGGGLLLLGGAKALTSPAYKKSPLGELFPLHLPADYRQGNYTVQITDTGLHHPVFGPLFAQVKNFPSLLTINVAEGSAPTAEILMETTIDGKQRPLVLSMPFGKGRVVAVLTDTLWRWRLAAGNTAAADRTPYEVFWAQLMDWLIPKEQQQQNSNKIELYTERSSYTLGEKPEVRALVYTPDATAKRPETLPLEVRTPDGKTFQYTLRSASLPGRDGKQTPGYRAEVEPNVAGVFQATSKTALGGAAVEGQTRFVVTPPPTEVTGRPIDRDLLMRIAEGSGGRFYPLGRWDQWRNDLHYQEQHFSRVQLSDLWNTPFLVGLLMTALAADWISRKFWNLP